MDREFLIGEINALMRLHGALVACNTLDLPKPVQAMVDNFREECWQALCSDLNTYYEGKG